VGGREGGREGWREGGREVTKMTCKRLKEEEKEKNAKKRSVRQKDNNPLQVEHGRGEREMYPWRSLPDHLWPRGWRP